MMNCLGGKMGRCNRCNKMNGFVRVCSGNLYVGYFCNKCRSYFKERKGLKYDGKNKKMVVLCK